MGSLSTWKRVAVVSGAVALAVVVAGCGGSGVNVQGGLLPPPENSTTAALPTPTAVAATAGFGAKQPAVDAVSEMLAAYNLAVRSPQKSSSAGFDKYLVGPAKATYDSSFAAAKNQGLALRGTPDELRISITSATAVGGSNLVDLVNCPLRSTIDPAVTYYVKTGAPFVATPTVGQAPQPWPTTFKLFQVNGSGPWKITAAQTNTSQTCDR